MIALVCGPQAARNSSTEKRKPGGCSVTYTGAASLITASGP